MPKEKQENLQGNLKAFVTIYYLLQTSKYSRGLSNIVNGI